MTAEQRAAVELRTAAADFAAGMSAPVTDARDRAGQKRNRRLLRAAVRYGVAKKRGYSGEFPTTREKRVYFMLDKIPPALWIRVKAKAKREGISLRTLILGWCQTWIDGEK